MKIKNLEKVAQRVKKAVTENERIIIYADSDMDGIASAVVLYEAIRSLGGNIDEVVFPDRENDGYGINLRALEYLKSKAPALFITLDLGIGNIKEIDIANSLGFEVIVVDHHEILEGLPKASIIIDPKQPGDESGLTHLANVGITFKLAQELLGEHFSEQQKNSFYELTALATISDMVLQIGDNKEFIEKGLRSLEKTFRPGLEAFFDVLGKGEIVSGGYMKIISALNAAESVNFKNKAFELLITPSKNACLDIAQELLGKVQYKQQRIQEITHEIERRISQKDEPIIFEGDPSWKLTLAGPVASIIAAKHEKPTFIFKKMDNESCGSVRSLKEGQNSVDAMKSCADILITYGGHPKASGFRVKNENLSAFKDRLIQHFESIKK